MVECELQQRILRDECDVVVVAVGVVVAFVGGNVWSNGSSNSSRNSTRRRKALSPALKAILTVREALSHATPTATTYAASRVWLGRRRPRRRLPEARRGLSRPRGRRTRRRRR